MSTNGAKSFRGVQSLLYKRHNNNNNSSSNRSESFVSHTRATLGTNPDGSQNTQEQRSIIYVGAPIDESTTNGAGHQRARYDSAEYASSSNEVLHARERKPTLTNNTIASPPIQLEVPPAAVEVDIHEEYEEAPLEEEEEVLSGMPRAVSLNKKESDLIAVLVSYDCSPYGKSFELRRGRWVVTSRKSAEFDSIVIDDPSISELHAVIRASGKGKVQVLDQLSEHGSGITRLGSSKEEQCEGTLASLQHGDLLRLGTKRYLVCMVPDRNAVTGE